MSLNHHLPKKISFVPKKHHGFQAVLWILGLLLPPLAVAARFGIGTDFFINVFLTICGYFPSHFHNFYIQNIRNNQNRARTPKWAIKAGLVDNSDRERRLKKSQWAKRFDERNNHSTLDDAELEEGEEGANYVPVNEREEARRAHLRNEGLWTDEDEEFYNQERSDRAANQQKWHYPANFEGTVGDSRGARRNGGAKAANGEDRWARSRARTNSSSSGSSYPPAAATDADVPEWGKDYGSKGRRSAKNNNNNKKDNKPAKAGGTGGARQWAANGGYVDDIREDDGWGRATPRDDGRVAQPQLNGGQAGRKQGGDIFDHEF